jgi:hypothetical protein
MPAEPPDASQIASAGTDSEPVTHPEAEPGGQPAASADDEMFWMAGQEAADAGFVADEAGDDGDASGEGAVPRESELLVGAWVNLKAQGEWVRAQLTWTSPRGGLYMFISASGLAHSMTRRTLDRLLGTDALQIVSRGGVVEGALDAVAQQALRNAQSDSDGDLEEGGGADAAR